MKILLIIISFFFITEAHGFTYSTHIGTSLSYLKINDPDYKFVNEYESINSPEITSLTFGQSFEFENKVVLDLTTNCLFNKSTSRSVISTTNNLTFLNKTKVTTDIISIGKRFKRVVPMIFVSNTKVDKELYYNNNLVGSAINHAWLYGINATYYITKEVSSSIFYIAPNDEMDLEGGLGIGFNYNF